MHSKERFSIIYRNHTVCRCTEKVFLIRHYITPINCEIGTAVPPSPGHSPTEVKQGRLYATVGATKTVWNFMYCVWLNTLFNWVKKKIRKQHIIHLEFDLDYEIIGKWRDREHNNHVLELIKMCFVFQNKFWKLHL